MTWYVASIIMSIKTNDVSQEEIPVYENFVLVEGKSPEEALEKATFQGKEEERINDDMELDGKSAKMVYEGVRKLINISNPVDIDPDKDRPMTGTELTYSQYLVSNEKQIQQLVDGESVILNYIE